MIIGLQQEDFPLLLETGRLLHSESRFKDEIFNPKAIEFFSEQIYKNPNKFFLCYDKDADGNIKGFFLGTLNFEYWTGKTTAVDMGMYVVPELRGSSIFLRMLKAFETWAKEHNASKIILYHSTGINPEKGKEMFPKLGYSHYGYIFDKEL